MLKKLLKGFGYGASFLFSAFSTDIWTTIVIGTIGAALLAIMLAGLIMHAVTSSANILIAASVLSLFTIPLGLGIFFLNKDRHTSTDDPTSEHQEDSAPDDSSWFTLSYVSNFGGLLSKYLGKSYIVFRSYICQYVV